MSKSKEDKCESCKHTRHYHENVRYLTCSVVVPGRPRFTGGIDTVVCSCKGFVLKKS